jgi:histidinol-phosphate aminotransferase
VKYPYNINILTQQLVMEQLQQVERKAEWVNSLLQQRKYLIERLQALPLQPLKRL